MLPSECKEAASSTRGDYDRDDDISYYGNSTDPSASKDRGGTWRAAPQPPAGIFDKTVCGNRVRARIVRRELKEGPRVIVFVHNPEPGPNGLFTLVEALLSPAA